MTLNSLFGISLNATYVDILYVIAEADREFSQFPFWDFVQCNTEPSWKLVNRLMDRGLSQFPFWDFFECNFNMPFYAVTYSTDFSQFPLWDFFECNQALVRLSTFKAS
jgi:hypothetical protein